MNTSEVKKLQEKIEQEIESMRAGIQGFAVGTAKHQFIESKMRRLGAYEDQLANHIGKKEAVDFSCQAYIRVLDENTQV